MAVGLCDEINVSRRHSRRVSLVVRRESWSLVRRLVHGTAVYPDQISPDAKWPTGRGACTMLLVASDRLSSALRSEGMWEQAVMSTMEERLLALESEVQAVKHQLATLRKPRAWLDEVAGSMDRWPEFEDVLRLGREFRESACDAPGTASDGG